MTKAQKDWNVRVSSDDVEFGEIAVRLPSWIAPRPTAVSPPFVLLRPSASPPGPAECFPPSDTRELAPGEVVDAPRSDERPAPASAERAARAELQEIAPCCVTSSELELVLRSENAELRAQLAEMGIAMARMRRDTVEASEPELVRLAMAIAERVVQRALDTHPDLVARWAHEGIQGLLTKDDVVIAVGPELAARVDPGAWAREVAVPHRLEVDPALPPFGCEVRAASCSVDASAAGRLLAVAEELGVPDR